MKYAQRESKLKIKSALSSKSKRNRQANETRILNQAIVELIKDEGFRNTLWERGQHIADKMNKVAKFDGCIQETYVERDHSSDSKYVHIRCARVKCKFNAWFLKLDSGLLKFARASYISHCPE